MQLRVSWKDISLYLQTRADPRAILRIVNLVRPRSDWRFAVVADAAGRTEVTISRQGNQPLLFEPTILLCGHIPEALNADTVAIHTGDSITRADGIVDLRHDGNVHVELPTSILPGDGTHRVVLTGYFGSVVPHVLGNEDALDLYLRERTWFGSPTYASNSRRVTWSFFNRLLEFRCSDAVPKELPKGGLNAAVVVDGGSVRVFTMRSMRQFFVRDADFGRLGDDEVPLRPVRDTLRRLGVRGALIEFGVQNLHVPTVLHGVLPTRDVGTLITQAAAAIEKSERFRSYARGLEQLRREEAAHSLTARIETATSGRMVYYNGLPLALEPTSEQGVVGIFHILEGQHSLPFHRFDSQAWAAAEGIDVIADVRLVANEPLQKLIPVEFEFDLRNFVAHEHPIEHVRLIVCWSVSGRVAGLTQTATPWLMKYRSGDHEIPVAVASRFPGVSLKPA
jgi:hypothetical protein